MNAIEFKANGKVFLFTAKSLIIDGREYSYTGMSAIKHSSSKHTYIFRYNDAWQQLVYDPADAQKLGTLFARIVKMNQTRLARQQTAAKAAAPVERALTVHPSATITGNESFAEALSKAIRESDAKIDASETPAKAPIEAQAETQVQAETQTETQTETQAEVQAEAQIEEASAKDAGDTEKKEPDNDLTPKQAEKKSKLKKALIIFAIIIGLFVLLGIGYFFVFGPTDYPVITPGTGQEQQYKDIDDLIEDLQK